MIEKNSDASEKTVTDSEEPVKRRRGRPRKVVEAEVPADSSMSTSEKTRVRQAALVGVVPRDQPSEWVVPKADAKEAGDRPAVTPRAAAVKPVDEGTVMHAGNEISDEEIRARREAARAVVADIGRMKTDYQEMSSYIAAPTPSSADPSVLEDDIPQQPLSRRDYWRQRREERYLQRQQRRMTNPLPGAQQPANNNQPFTPRPSQNGPIGPDNQSRHLNRRERQRQRQHQRFDGNPPERTPPPSPVPPQTVPSVVPPAQNLPPMAVSDLQGLAVDALLSIAREQGINDGLQSLGKHEVVFSILRNHANRGGSVIGEGILEICAEGLGFLRNHWNSYKSCPEDAMVPQQVIRKYGLRAGDKVAGATRAPSRDMRDKRFVLTEVSLINGQTPEELVRLPLFDTLVPTYPARRIKLETSRDEIAMRVADLLTPAGFGQRTFLVAPPHTGKTAFIQKMANAISTNHPDAELVVLLIGERPEDVTEMERNTRAKVFASTFDESPEQQVQVAEVLIELARRRVEEGRDVVILLDSITRLTRAYHAIQPNGGKLIAGVLDANALQGPRRFLGAARAIEGGGSLTILATALVETGNKLDEVVFEELRGAENSLIRLDRGLADRGLFPALDVGSSGTLQSDRLLNPDEAAKIPLLRKTLDGAKPAEALETLVKRLRAVSTNAELLVTLKA